jgi:5'-AMP-activated protein kinase catalytic alpha subunit
LSEIEACKFIQELISGIEYIHKLNIVHRDLKPENLLLDYGKNLKIVDFGLSNTYK